MSGLAEKSARKLNRSGVIRIFTVLGTLVAFGAMLFVAAGRLDWPQAWIFLGIYVVGLAANGLTMRHNPDLINERGQMGKNAKSWDKLIGLAYTLLMIAIYIVAGLDQRLGWSAVPVWVEAVGGIVFVLAMALISWVMAVNNYLSTYVRIQDERGQTTVSNGPYCLVRHPMYMGIQWMSWGTPLLLGSWWALLPGLFIIALFFLRTALEDKTLQAELPGYAEYAQKVRYRLIPGIW